MLLSYSGNFTCAKAHLPGGWMGGAGKARLQLGGQHPRHQMP